MKKILNTISIAAIAFIMLMFAPQDTFAESTSGDILSAQLCVENKIGVIINAKVSDDVTEPTMDYIIAGSKTTVEGNERLNGTYDFEISVCCSQMKKSIKFVLKDGDTVLDTVSGFSIASYCNTLANTAPKSLGMTQEKFNAMRTFMADMLEYGAYCQLISSYDVKHLSNTESWVNTYKTQTFTKPDTDKQVIIRGTTDRIKSAAMILGDRVRLTFSVITSNASKAILKIEKASGEILTFAVNEGEYITEGGISCYEIVTDGIYTSEFADKYELKLYIDGTLVSHMVYSINSYINSKCEDSTTPYNPEVLKSLYNYEQSALAYVNTIGWVEPESETESSSSQESSSQESSTQESSSQESSSESSSESSPQESSPQESNSESSSAQESSSQESSSESSSSQESSTSQESSSESSSSRESSTESSSSSESSSESSSSTEETTQAEQTLPETKIDEPTEESTESGTPITTSTLYFKISGTTLNLRATAKDGYTKETISGSHLSWNENETITTVNFEEPISPTSGKFMFYKMTKLDGFKNFSNLHVDKMESAYAMFYQCESLTELDLTSWDTTSMTDMSGMFAGCSSLTQLDQNFNTANVTTLRAIFQSCSALESIDVSGWNTKNVTDLRKAFVNCNKLASVDVENWDTSKVETLYQTFGACNAIKELDLTNWDVSAVTDMTGTFRYCNELTTIEGLDDWDTSKVTTMLTMFNGSAQNQYKGSLSNETLAQISDWDVSNVTDMTCMFYGQGKYTTMNLSNWDVSSCESFNHMFCDDISVQTIGDLSNWDVSSLKTTYNMFNDCRALKTLGDISDWNTENLIDCGTMFTRTYALEGVSGKLDLSGWDTSKVKSMGGMFSSCSKLTEIDLSGWDTSATTADAWTGAGDGIYYAYGNAETYYKCMSRMFVNCTVLTKVTVGSKWTTEGKTATDLFSGCAISAVTVK